MSRKLIVNDGRREREMLLIGRLVVGRDPLCDISEADPLMSRRHAEFVGDGDAVVVRDLGSRNGIYVNGARIAEGSLQSGDLIQIGHLQLQFIEDDAPLAAPPDEDEGDATAVLHPPAAASTPAPSGVRPPSMAVPPPAAALAAPPPPVPPTPPPMAAVPVQAAPAPAVDPDEVELTSLVPPPIVSQLRASGTWPPVNAAPDASGSRPGFEPGDDDQTRVVAPPELRAAIHMAMAHPPTPSQAAAQLAPPPPSAAAAATIVTGSGRMAPPPPDEVVASPSTTSIQVPGPASVLIPRLFDTPDTLPLSGNAPAPATAPSPSAAAAALTAPAAAPASSAVSPSVPAGAWTPFVQMHVGIAAGAVALAGLLFPALPLSSVESAGLLVAVAGVAAFVVAAMIAERPNAAARSLKQDVEAALAGRLDAIRDPLGTPASKELADTLNGLVARVRESEGSRR